MNNTTPHETAPQVLTVQEIFDRALKRLELMPYFCPWQTDWIQQFNLTDEASYTCDAIIQEDRYLVALYALSWLDESCPIGVGVVLFQGVPVALWHKLGRKRDLSMVSLTIEESTRRKLREYLESVVEDALDRERMDSPPEDSLSSSNVLEVGPYLFNVKEN